MLIMPEEGEKIRYAYIWQDAGDELAAVDRQSEVNDHRSASAGEEYSRLEKT